MNVLKAAFKYHCETVRDGKVVDQFEVTNLIPVEGLNALLNYIFKGTTVPAGFFIGLYEGNYAPQPGDTAATFPAAATETTAYAEATRRPFVAGAVSGGSVDNVASRAEFNINADKTLYGGFVSSTSAKNGGTGVLLSAVQFPSPKVLQSGDVFSVTTSFNLIPL